MIEPDGATPLDPDEASALRLDSIETRNDLNRVEQANIVDGLRWLNSKRKVEVLSEPFLRELHHRLFGQVWSWAGKFRKTEKNIGVDPLHIPVELRNLLDDCKAQVEFSSYPPQEIALRFHHRLVKTHLFANGNGRHARIAADALLTQTLEQPPIQWITVVDLQQASPQRNRYIQALRAADAHNYNPLLSLYATD